jgi:hypothetical protein
MQVKEFAANNQTFSVFDITRTIREKTAQGELEIPEVEVSGAEFRFDISHPKVKALFDELYRTGVFDSEFTLARTFTGMIGGNASYFEYTPTLVGNVATTPAPVAPPVTPNYPWGPASNPTPPAVPQSVTPAPVGGNDITNRVQQYLAGCVIRNFRPTLKQVQSAIKRNGHSTGVSCEDLKVTIQSLGFTVVDDPESVSRAQVATV